MIDTGSLTDLITAFRRSSQAQSVSPETVGSILQKIVDILATAGTEADVTIVQQWHEALKAAQPALTSLSQGKSDRNHVYLNSKRVNLYTGAVTDYNDIQIQQATTERAGAMRAQQVIDLNAAKKSVGEIERQIATINSLLQISSGESLASVVYKVSQISCHVVDGELKIRGATQLVKDGYIPYLFRYTGKRNQYKHVAEGESKPKKKYCARTKGWNLYGSRYTVNLHDQTLTFSTNAKVEYCNPAQAYSTAASILVSNHVNKKGHPCFGWGRSVVSLLDPRNPQKYRLIRLRFAIGFAKPMNPSRALITPANLVSSLAEFHIIFDPKTAQWKFSK